MAKMKGPAFSMYVSIVLVSMWILVMFGVMYIVTGGE